MQRLFSMFPNGWPGAGLLLLRLIPGLLMLREGVAGHGVVIAPVLLHLLVGAASLLIAGLWTPLAGALGAAIEVWTAWSETDARAALALASICLALAMLGPGFWSIDRMLYGRRRLVIGDDKG